MSDNECLEAVEAVERLLGEDPGGVPRHVQGLEVGQVLPAPRGQPGERVPRDVQVAQLLRLLRRAGVDVRQSVVGNVQSLKGRQWQLRQLCGQKKQGMSQSTEVVYILDYIP